MATHKLTISGIYYEYSNSGVGWGSNDGEIHAGNQNNHYVTQMVVTSDTTLSKATIELKIPLGGDCKPYNIGAYVTTTQVTNPNQVYGSASGTVYPVDSSGNRIATGWVSINGIGTSGTIYYRLYVGTLSANTSYYVYFYDTTNEPEATGSSRDSLDGAGGINSYSATAIYTPQYTLTVTKGTGITSVSGGGTYDEGTYATVNAVVSTGYTWSGWTGTAPQSLQSFGVLMNQNHSITANATRNSYTVTYNKGSLGTGTQQTQSTLHGAAITIKGAIFTRTGYTQTGWATSDGGSKVYNLSQSFSEGYGFGSSITLYPTWAANTYRLTFNANGGTNTSGGNFALSTPATGYGATESWVTVTYDSSNFSAMSGNNPTRIGYKFLGWYTAASGGTQIYDADGGSTNNGTYWSTSGTWNSASNRTVYAQWEALATMFVKVDGSYKAGIPYVKVNGDWKRATAVYVKVDGEWKLSTR